MAVEIITRVLFVITSYFYWHVYLIGFTWDVYDTSYLRYTSAFILCFEFTILLNRAFKNMIYLIIKVPIALILHNKFYIDFKCFISLLTIQIIIYVIVVTSLNYWVLTRKDLVTASLVVQRWLSFSSPVWHSSCTALLSTTSAATVPRTAQLQLIPMFPPGSATTAPRTAQLLYSAPLSPRLQQWSLLPVLLPTFLRSSNEVESRADVLGVLRSYGLPSLNIPFTKRVRYRF